MSDKTALYRHFDENGDLLYVGISISAVQRLSQHRSSSPWFEQIAKVDIEWHPTREAALRAEREAIISERPRYNKMHNAANDNQVKTVINGWRVYLIRHREEKAIDGFVWAKTDADLWDVVDESFDPADYEYAEVTGCGGLLVDDGLGPVVVQAEDADEDAPDFTCEKFVPSSLLCDDLYQQERLTWIAFDVADEGVGVIARAMREAAA